MITDKLKTLVDRYTETRNEVHKLEENREVNLYIEKNKLKEDLSKKIREEFKNTNSNEFDSGTISDGIRYITKEVTQYSPQSALEILGPDALDILSVSTTKLKKKFSEHEIEQIDHTIEKSFVFYFS